MGSERAPKRRLERSRASDSAWDMINTVVSDPPVASED